MTRMNPLHTAETVAHHTRVTGEYFDQTRGTGRSTALALEYISQAIKSPYKAVHIRDHVDGAGARSIQRDTSLVHRIADMVAALRLKHFTFNYSEFTITFGVVYRLLTPQEVMHGASTVRLNCTTPVGGDWQKAFETLYGRRI